MTAMPNQAWTEAQLLQQIIVGCDTIKRSWLTTSDQKRLAAAQEEYWTTAAKQTNGGPLTQLLALYSATKDTDMAETKDSTAKGDVSDVVKRIIALIEKLKAFGPFAGQALAWLELMLQTMTGTPTAKTAVHVKCGPGGDGCCDCGQCIEAAICAQLQALCQMIQAQKCNCCPTPNGPPTP